MNMATLEGVWHFSFTVRDIERSVAFYRDALGLVLVARQRQANEYTSTLVGFKGADLEVAQLRVPGMQVGASGHHLELLQYVSPRSDAATPTRNAVGSAHMAFVCEEIDGVYRRLVGEGVQFVSPPTDITEGVNRGGKTCYFLDPDGITLELVKPPNRSG